MSYQDCLSCKDAQATPAPAKGVCIVYDPAIQMPGTPTIQDRRIAAVSMAEAVMVEPHGVADVMRGWRLSREEVLVACWWAGRFGPRRFRVWRQWAEDAGSHLWYRCINIPDPPPQAAP